MNEIEKLYENAGVEKIYDCYICPYNDCEDKCKVDMETNYPYFTAEKQLELIKWFAKNQQGFCLDYWIGKDGNNWECGVISEWEVLSISENFEEALSGLINLRWQDLTEDERKQIKEILE